MIDISANIAKVHARIQHAALENSLNPTDICLLAVSKTRSVQEIELAHQTGGLIHFGENYAQEAIAKMRLLTHLPLVWHFIGPVQSNKTRVVAEHFDWLHSLDRLNVAERLHTQRPQGASPLNVCIQVNIDDEDSKSGISPSALPDFVASLLPLTHLAIRGLMVMPKPDQTPAQTLASFQQAAHCLTRLRERFPDLPLDTLSMGMSADLELAIAAGSTLVRIGTDIFGPRNYTANQG